MDRWLAFSLGIVACLGCGRPAPDPATPAGRLELAALPGAMAASDPTLQAELALVRDERGLPLDLVPAESRQAEPTRPQAARQLDQAFPPLSRSLVRGPLDGVYAGGPLALSPVQLERGRELVRKHAAASNRFRAALPAEPGGFGPRLADGMLADVSFLEPLDLGCRLEAVAAAVKIADGEPGEAYSHLATLLAAARVLAAEPNVTTRVAAANIRRDSLSVLAAIVAHDRCPAEMHRQLFDLLSRETGNWPADAICWIGDRSAGLITYELVREGHYLSLLAADEVERLRAEHNLDAIARAAIRTIDADERFYLQSMRQLIDACQRPYCERHEVLAAIRHDIQRKEQSADYPLVAATLLLADFETAQLRQAEDIARVQAWLLALGTALGQESPAALANPLTGRPYAVARSPLAVTVAGVLPTRDEPCLVPLPPPRAARR